MSPPVFDAYREARLSVPDSHSLTMWIILACVLCSIILYFTRREKRRSFSTFG